ncbi:MAG: hypothetical protein FWG82_03995 [Oscillospiraceae bacterium]|nr:hypothetical protein [Oscillospiraceae bacterium]
MKKTKIIIGIAVALFSIILLFLAWLNADLTDPRMEYDRILYSIDEVLTAHEEIQGHYENPTIIRGASGNYFVVFDLTHDIQLGVAFSEMTHEGRSIGCVRVRSRFFDFGKIKIKEFYYFTDYEKELVYPNLLVNVVGIPIPVRFGKFMDDDVMKIEIYVEDILEQTWLRNKDERFGTKDFFLIELDEKRMKKNHSRTRMVYYNSKGEVLYMS